MWISQIKLQNIRSFVSEEVELSRSINILIGENGAGKSTIIDSIRYACCPELDLSYLMLREGITPKNSRLTIAIEDASRKGANVVHGKTPIKLEAGIFIKNMEGQQKPTTMFNGEQVLRRSTDVLTRPDNPIEPFLATRKQEKLDTRVGTEFTQKASGSFNQLNALVDELRDELRPQSKFFKKAVKETLGTPNITTESIAQGKRVAYYTGENNNAIPVDSLGEGTKHILYFIAILAMSENKVFLIEEIENDLHPKALKSLLHYIKEKASSNQFIISTHSNIVLRELASYRDDSDTKSDTKVFNVKRTDRTEVPTSTVNEIETEPDSHKILADLGYALADFGLWDGYLFFEESSAEGIVENFLGPWFAESLMKKIKTFGGKGINTLEKTIKSFKDLFVFVHLTPVYQDKFWVIVDSGDNEEKAVASIRKFCPEMSKDNFIQLQKHDFEEYYPDRFKAEVEKTLAINNSDQKKTAKEELLKKVINWCESNADEAKEAFRDSADEVIKHLQKIERAMCSNSSVDTE